MNIDQEYLKKILNTFIESDRPFVELYSFENAGIEIDDKFLFHMRILEDQSFVESYNGMKGLGYVVALAGNFEWISKPIRLTAAGNEFAEALNRKELWEVIKRDFKDASVSTLSKASKELLKAFVKKKVEKHFEI